MAQAKKAAANKRRPHKGTQSKDTRTAAHRKHTTGAKTKEAAAKKTAPSPHGKKPSSTQACWPGYEPTPGKAAGEKGSCQPKAKQTAAERKGDQKAAAASRLSGQRA